ncbi:unnamed protein product [Blepharisma stoltei]|uniref:Uncharacterized protein n=1 Tax=Blepharisma stoltei TaxID=1481888 RepID=A0AAU9I8Q0_9CILI|nr:unnamed protein product [Blepharisma stoltei]
MTRYIHIIDETFPIHQYEDNNIEKFNYFHLKKEWENNFKTASACCKILYDKLNKLDINYIKAEIHLKDVFDLYGDGGKYSFLRKYETWMEKKIHKLMIKYNYIRNHWNYTVDEFQKNIGNLDNTNCIYFTYQYLNKGNIIMYDPVLKKKAFKTFEAYEIKDNFVFIVKLPNNKLFLGGESSYIVSTATFTIKDIAWGAILLAIYQPIIDKWKNGIYHENCIYIFGKGPSHIFELRIKHENMT